MKYFLEGHAQSLCEALRDHLYCYKYDINKTDLNLSLDLSLTAFWIWVHLENCHTLNVSFNVQNHETL